MRMSPGVVAQFVATGSDLANLVGVRLDPVPRQEKRDLEPVPVEQVQKRHGLVIAPGGIDGYCADSVITRHAVDRHQPAA